ncbi:MAG: hypothetical protein DDT19_01563 [Syntrophomonadaceae bacterium]|nr:hypothetical protein [Bacillota bacterium]
MNKICVILLSTFCRMAMRPLRCCLILTTALLLCCSTALYSTTLSTNFADVFVGNLKLGGSYNLTEVANMPMWIGYRGGEPTELKIDVITPTATELKAGYEPIPDTAWITVSRANVALLPDESANLDVTINIPNDEKYLGKKYQAYIHIVSAPPKDAKGLAVSLALKGRVLFGIAQKPPTEEELRELRRKKVRASQGVMITPEKFEIQIPLSPPLQRGKIEVTEDVPLKIINTSREKVDITLEAVEPDASGVSLPRGYEKGKVSDVSLSKRKFSLKPDKIKNVKIYLEQQRSRAAEQKVFYVIRIIVKSKTIEIAKFVRIYLE